MDYNHAEDSNDGAWDGLGNFCSDEAGPWLGLKWIEGQRGSFSKLSGLKESAVGPIIFKL